MPINVDPAALEQASAAVNSAISECESTTSQLTAAKASLDGSINATISATNTALSGWSAGMGFAAFESAQAKLKTQMGVFDEQIASILTVSQRLNSLLLEFQAALGSAGGTFNETDSQIAASWSRVN